MAFRAVSQLERDELEAVLKAKVLLRSPSVLRVATYIVNKYLQGEAEGLKEYNIAVEALGKPDEFDPKRDSIVRVEAHRLRKKLIEYYKTEGSDHELQIVIDPGQYTLRFVARTDLEASVAPIAPLEESQEPTPQVETPVAGARRASGFLRWLLLTFAVVVPALVFLAWRFRPSQPTLVPEAVRLMSGAPGSMVVVSATGDRWRGDEWFQGGTEVNGGEPVTEAVDVPLSFQRQGNFDYAIPLSDAPYELRLYFSPRMTSTGAALSIARGFDVLANGAKLMDALDPGVSIQKRGITRVFHDIRPASDGRLHLSFRNGAEIAYVNSIELTAGETGKLMPIRIIAKAAPYTQPNGVTWAADRYFTGAHSRYGMNM